MDNASERKQVAAAAKRAKADHQRTGNVVRSICSTEPGRRFLWEQLEQCAVFSAIYPSHPNLGAILGERNVGLRLLALVTEFCPNMFIKMMEEAHARRELDGLSQQSRSPDSGGDTDGPEPDYDPDPSGVYREFGGGDTASH